MKEEEKIEWKVGYWFNEQKQYEFSYVNEKRHGIETWWHSNGQKWIERTWVNGDMHGINTWWYSNDSLGYVSKWNQGQFVVGFEFKISEVPQGKVPEIDILFNAEKN
jgi:antitoxin component YwqK of YwqJK toxin-antitoxin module